MIKTKYIIQNDLLLKCCTTCNIFKPLSDFYKRTQSPITKIGAAKLVKVCVTNYEQLSTEMHDE